MRHFVCPIRMPTFLALGAALAVAACSEPAKPVQPSRATPLTPAAAVTTVYDDYPSSGVLTSTGDTCPNYIVPSTIEDPFWSGTDAERVQNPDSVAAADSLTKGDSTYNAPLAVIDASTGAELEAGPCDVLYNRCTARCRRLRSKKDRALCWAGCMARFAECRAEEAARKYFTPPTQCPAQYSTQLIYDPDDPTYYSDDCGSSGPGGGGGGGTTTGSGCHTEWVTIEIDVGYGWETYWEGYATVCD